MRHHKKNALKTKTFQFTLLKKEEKTKIGQLEKYVP